MFSTPFVLNSFLPSESMRRPEAMEGLSSPTSSSFVWNPLCRRYLPSSSYSYSSASPIASSSSCRIRVMDDATTVYFCIRHVPLRSKCFLVALPPTVCCCYRHLQHSVPSRCCCCCYCCCCCVCCVAVSAVCCCCRHVSCVMIISWSLMFQLAQLIWCVEELSIAR